jgi:hypothetical protein
MSPLETIYTALFNLLRTAPGLRTASRRLRHWDDVPSNEQPALFLAQGNINAEFETGLPTVWTCRADVFLYVKTGGDLHATPASVFNPILDSIISKLLPPPHLGEQTLGGLVHRCRIEGEIETDEGTLGDQAVVIIPVTMFVPQ